MKSDQEIAELHARLRVLDRERQVVQKRLAELASPSLSAPGTTHVSNTSPASEKVALFRGFFAGRTDVYPIRWENAPAQKSGYAPACSNEWRRGVCGKPQVKCTECPNQAFVPVSDEMIANHLRGETRSGARALPFVAGVYPLLANETCWFLAADFDGESWSRDALAFIETCRERNVPAALERSRSGQGGHVWIFFSEPVAARDARGLSLGEDLAEEPDRADVERLRDCKDVGDPWFHRTSLVSSHPAPADLCLHGEVIHRQSLRSRNL